MIYDSKKELAMALDEVIARFMSFNFNIEDTEHEHSLFIFMIVREGFKLRAVSPTREVINCSVKIDCTFTVDEILQDLSDKCGVSINKSKRYYFNE